MNTGMPHNQLGTLAGGRYYNVDAAYHYMRWCVVIIIVSVEDDVISIN